MVHQRHLLPDGMAGRGACEAHAGRVYMVFRH